MISAGSLPRTLAAVRYTAGLKVYSPSGGVSASEKEAASPQRCYHPDRNPALTDMNQPSGGAHMASIMAFSSGMLALHRSGRMAQE